MTDESGGTTNLYSKIINYQSSSCGTVNDGTYIRCPKDSSSTYIAALSLGTKTPDRPITGFRVYLRAKDDSSFSFVTGVVVDIVDSAGSSLTGAGGAILADGSNPYSTSAFEWKDGAISLSINTGQGWNAFWAGKYLGISVSTDTASGSTHYFKFSEVQIKACWGNASP